MKFFIKVSSVNVTKSRTFIRIHRKALVLESLFNKVARDSNAGERDCNIRAFKAFSIAKFLRTAFL